MSTTNIPPSAQRVPPGKIAVTLDVEGSKPLYLAMDASDLDGRVKQMDAAVRRQFGPPEDMRTHLKLRDEVLQVVGEGCGGGDNEPKLLATLLWLALNHPDQGEGARAEMAEALRRNGKAHLTMAVDQRGRWGLDLRDRYVDMNPLLAALLENAPTSFSIGRPIPTRRMH